MSFLLVLVLKTLTYLPFTILYLISDLLALTMKIVGYRKGVVDENLKKSFPEKSYNERIKIRDDFYQNLSDVIVESLKSFSISKREIDKRVRFINPESTFEFIKKEQPFITLSSHQCNWEWQLLASCLLGFQIDAAYKEIRNKPIEKLMFDMRSKFGAKLIESKQFLRTAIKRKNEVRGIAMVGDQRPGKNTDFRTRFLNQDTGMFTGAEKLAKAFDYPVLFMEMHRVKRGYYEITLKELAEPPYDKSDYSITQKYVELLENSLKEKPSEWLWSHKRWKN